MEIIDKIKCEICGKEYKKLGILIHKSIIHKIRSKNYDIKDIIKNPIKCKICKEDCNGFKGLVHHIELYRIKMKEYYDNYLKVKNSNEGICLTCGKETKFTGLNGGYCKFCSFKCSNNSLEVKEKKEKTNLKNRGTSNPFKSKEVIEKIKKVHLKKCGFDNWAKSQQGKLSSRITAIKWTEKQRLNGEPLCPHIGDMERDFLDILQSYTSFKILRNDPSFRYEIGYFPDGHILELKLFIQFDELAHFLDKQECKIYKEKDNECTLNLSSMGYIVWRISELEWKNNREKIIEQFKSLVQNLTEEYVK